MFREFGAVHAGHWLARSTYSPPTLSHTHTHTPKCCLCIHTHAHSYAPRPPALRARTQAPAHLGPPYFPMRMCPVIPTPRASTCVTHQRPHRLQLLREAGQLQLCSFCVDLARPNHAAPAHAAVKAVPPHLGCASACKRTTCTAASAAAAASAVSGSRRGQVGAAAALQARPLQGARHR